MTGSDVIDPQPYLEYLRDKQAALSPVTAAFAKPGADSIALAALERAQAIFDSCAALVRAELPAEAVLWDAHTHLGDDIDGMRGGPPSCSESSLPTVSRARSRSASTSRIVRRHSARPTTVRSRTRQPIPASSRSCAWTWRTLRSRRRSAASTSAHGESSCIRGRRSSRSETSASSRSSSWRRARGVPILIHGGRGLPPIADHLAALVRRYTGTRLIIAHAGIADMAALAGHFGGVPGVYFDTSVWSAVDLLDLLRQVAPEQVLFATDYPYGRLPNALLLVLRVTRLSGLDEKQIRGVLGATAAGIAAGEPPPELSAPRGITTLVQPLTFARISQYVSMATPLLWMRQPDAAGGLGLAVNAALEEHAHVEEAEMIREALVTASELWSAVPEVADEAERRRVGDHAKWLVHIAGILAATTHG